MIQNSKYLVVKMPLDIHNSTEYPEPSFYREITALKDGKIQPAYIESVYWFNHDIYSQKQLLWLADTKTKIQKLIPDARFTEYNDETDYLTASGETFDLKRFSKVWSKIKNRKLILLDKIKDCKTATDDFYSEPIIIPSLIPIELSGKIEYRMYKVLTQYASKLYYSRLLQFEYLYRASRIYNKNSEDKMLPKQLLKLTHKAFDFITEEINNHPDNFKQKLEPKELRNARIKNAVKLQANNKKIRFDNTVKLKEAIESGKHYKADGTTINVSSIANACALTRVTASRILTKLQSKS
jgi:hypothetical protein